MNKMLETKQVAKVKHTFTQTPPEDVWYDNWYFDNDGLYGLDFKNGIIIAGNRSYTDMYYIEDDIKNELLEMFEVNYSCYREDIVRFLTKKTGKEYVWTTIRGCSQSDWNVLYYPKNEFSKGWIREIEAFYFGEINEYIDEDNCSWQVPYYEEQKEYLSQQTGIDVDNIIIKEFVGYKKTPIYKEI